MIIGAGVAGRHHERVLVNAGRTIVAILDSAEPDFATDLEDALQSAPTDAIWHICTPTATHLAYIQLIRTRCPLAGAIVEKPIGRPGEVISFASFGKSGRIMVQSQYSYARCVSLYRRHVNLLREGGPTVVQIDFAKDRTKDIGRFVDNDRGAFGYEGFHQIALGLRLLGGNRCHTRRPVVIESACRNHHGFFAKMRIGVDHLYISSSLDRPMRHAWVEARAGGQSVRLDLETREWFTGVPRQTHFVAARNMDSIVEEDLIETGILACVDALTRGDTARIEKNFRAAIAVETLLDRLVSSSTDFSRGTRLAVSEKAGAPNE